MPGVVFDKRVKRWKAHIFYDGRKHHLGYHSSEEAARLAYDLAARTTDRQRHHKLNYNDQQFAEMLKKHGDVLREREVALLAADIAARQLGRKHLNYSDEQFADMYRRYAHQAKDRTFPM